MNPVLLTVSGTIPNDIEEKIRTGERPEADYIAMSKAFQADLIDYPAARRIAGWFGRLLEFLWGPELVLAWACFLMRKQYRLIFTDGEQIGIPFAFFSKFLGGSHSPKHFMIVHILSVRKKQVFFSLGRVQTHIDRFFVYSSFQKRFIQEHWHIPGARVTHTPFMVDHYFFSAGRANPVETLHLSLGDKPLICSVGLEYRDYPTLIEAVKDLDIQVVIAAGSPWSKRKDSTHGQRLPDHILVKRFTQYELRDLYAACRFMVMPLYNVEFQAGVTAILEAMAMGKPVICSRTPGQTDVIVDGQNGIYVPPGDALALRQAIQEMLDKPEATRQIGEAGRKLIAERMNLEKYTQFLNQFIQMEIQTSSPSTLNGSVLDG